MAAPVAINNKRGIRKRLWGSGGGRGGGFSVLCLFAAGAGLATVNPLLTAAGMLVPIALVYLLWRPSEPPVMLFAVGMQWLQAYTPVLSADMAGVTMHRRFGGPELE